MINLNVNKFLIDQNINYLKNLIKSKLQLNYLDNISIILKKLNDFKINILTLIFNSLGCNNLTYYIINIIIKKNN